MLVRQGRIIDATVIDISDLDAEESCRPKGMQLILYKYEIAGVVYECSQDVTMFDTLSISTIAGWVSLPLSATIRTIRPTP